jgi:hypothetical protein
VHKKRRERAYRKGRNDCEDPGKFHTPISTDDTSASRRALFSHSISITKCKVAKSRRQKVPRDVLGLAPSNSFKEFSCSLKTYCAAHIDVLRYRCALTPRIENLLIGQHQKM